MKTIITITAIALLTGCTIEQPVNMPDTATPAVTTPQRTESAPVSTYTRENQFLNAIHSVHEGPVYVSDAELLDAGWATCEGVAEGATAQDMVRIINESATDTDTFNLLVELSVAALMFLCPEYEYILQELNTI